MLDPLTTPMSLKGTAPPSKSTFTLMSGSPTSNGTRMTRLPQRTPETEQGRTTASADTTSQVWAPPQATSSRSKRSPTAMPPAQTTMPWDYTYITVWTSPQDAVTPSISFSDDMEPGGSFAFEITLSAPNAHYQIESDSVVVEVEGSGPGFWQRVTESSIGSAIVAAGGWIGKHVGKKVVVKVTAKVVLTATGVGAGVALIAEEGIRHTYNHFVRSELAGWLNCAVDLYPLGTLAQPLGMGGTYPASASVYYKEIKGNDEYRTNTKHSGEFVFEVPCGKALEVTGSHAQNYHNCNGKGHRVLFYGKSQTYLVAPIGTKGSWVPIIGGYDKAGRFEMGSILMPPKLNF